MKSALDQTTDVPANWCADLQGWHSTDQMFKQLIDEIRPKRIIEVGSWKGASAIHMASLTKEMGTCIYCVDTWLGGVDHMISNDQGYKPEENFIYKKDGYPQTYYQFLHNVRESGYADRIFPIPNTSANGARYLKSKDVKADLIYIDGSHECADCMLDIILYQECLATNGVMFGDDWAFPGVAQAVTQWLIKHPAKKGFVEDSGFWIIR